MTDLDFKTIGMKIKERRRALGITQEYVANCLDVNPSHISNIECGRANPSLTALVAISSILNCSIDYFIGSEYHFSKEKDSEKNLDSRIMDRIICLDIDTKTKLLKILDVL